jgi:hypothetical protein
MSCELRVTSLVTPPQLTREVLEATNYIWHQILNCDQIPKGIKFLIGSAINLRSIKSQITSGIKFLIASGIKLRSIKLPPASNS